MAKIILAYRMDKDIHGNVKTYSLSFHRELKALGHEVLSVGEGHKLEHINKVEDLNAHDLFIDLDSGRNKKGNLHFQLGEDDKPLRIKSVIRLIDSHGYPSLHRRIAKKYDHVFFAVWDKRNLFKTHKSAHWCPNTSDPTYFDYRNHIVTYSSPRYHVGFFGSKGGLDRCNDLITICKNNRYKYDVRELGTQYKNRWPRTAAAMANCKILFNRGQKHDGPNQRVIESMFLKRPLITDRDDRNGMNKVFKEGEHYLAYSDKVELASLLSWCIKEPKKANTMANRAYVEAYSKHQVKHRVKQILEVALV